MDIVVNTSVLIPRPETELLAEQGWKFLNMLGRESTFLDFGTVHFPGVSRVVGAALASGEWRMTALVERLACLRRADWVAPDWLSRD